MGRNTSRRAHRTATELPRRVAMLSLHTSPLEQPGVGDAGGMNVYVWEVSKRLAAAGVAVEIFTRATDSTQPAVEQVADRLLVRHIVAGPFQGLRKEDLPGQMCALSAGVLRAEAARPEGWYDLIHSHYWLSGQVGWVAKERWGIPLVHSMHTLAKVKNRDRGDDDTREPDSRVIGEQQVVEVADSLIANTRAEADDLLTMYQADPNRVHVVHPGVDLDVFSPRDSGAARARLGLPARRPIVVFVGRLQPLKAPDLVLAAVARMRPVGATGDEPLVIVCGGPSGNGSDMPDQLRVQARDLGLEHRTLFWPPLAKDSLVDLFRAADVVAVPSHSESFGLVAIEAQACGAPVVASDVGGLRTAIDDGTSGLLVASRDPGEWARTFESVLSDRALTAGLREGARRQAQQFGWDATTAHLLRVYRDARTGSAPAWDADRRGA
ncbi:MAG: D-inositol-3-phosphate glycosyltransferase [Actinobacteria bacterium]|nr:D-inositol-3-phosphate glycosyltransferase [Actinomycetota bacterium]MCB9411758.1 D-inositol-3-phosphate glycosyltransferase [Actinomycetota bacterium]